MSIASNLSGILLLLLIVSPVYADSKAPVNKSELIKELLHVSDVKNHTVKNFDASIEQLKNSTLPQMAEAAIVQRYGAKAFNELPVDKRETSIKQFSNKVADSIKREVSEKLDIVSISEDILAKLYTRHFEAHELQQLIDFYRSPTGKKAVTLMPQITAEAMKASAEATDKVIIDIYMRLLSEEMVIVYRQLFPDACKDKKNVKPQKSTKNKKQ